MKTRSIFASKSYFFTELLWKKRQTPPFRRKRIFEFQNGKKPAENVKNNVQLKVDLCISLCTRSRIVAINQSKTNFRSTTKGAQGPGKHTYTQCHTHLKNQNHSTPPGYKRKRSARSIHSAPTAEHIPKTLSSLLERKTPFDVGAKLDA